MTMHFLNKVAQYMYNETSSNMYSIGHYVFVECCDKSAFWFCHLKMTKWLDLFWFLYYTLRVQYCSSAMFLRRSGIMCSFGDNGKNTSMIIFISAAVMND